MKKKIGTVTIFQDDGKGGITYTKSLWGSIKKSEITGRVWKSIYFVVDTDTHECFLENLMDFMVVNGKHFKVFHTHSTWYMDESFRYTLSSTDSEGFGELCEELDGFELKDKEWSIKINVNKDWDIVKNEWIMRNL